MTPENQPTNNLLAVSRLSLNDTFLGYKLFKCCSAEFTLSEHIPKNSSIQFQRKLLEYYVGLCRSDSNICRTVALYLKKNLKTLCQVHANGGIFSKL